MDKEKKDNHQKEEELKENQIELEKDNKILELQNELQEQEKKIKESEDKINEYYSYLQRLQADFDNYKKITDREKEEIKNYVTCNIVEKMLPLIDNIQLARKSIDTSFDIEKLKTGIDLIMRQFDIFLEKMNIEKIKTEDEFFSATCHDAVCFEDVDNKENGKILEEIQAGYKFGDKIIRCAKVKVAKSKLTEE